MKLLIVSARDSLMWYSDKIGQTVDFVREDSEYYWSRDNGGYINIVHKADAKKVEYTELDVLLEAVDQADCRSFVKTTYDDAMMRGVKAAIREQLERRYANNNRQ